MKNRKKILSTLNQRGLHRTQNIFEYIYFQNMQQQKNRFFEAGKQK